jgi:hypothetical protein
MRCTETTFKVTVGLLMRVHAAATPTIAEIRQMTLRRDGRMMLNGAGQRTGAGSVIGARQDPPYPNWDWSLRFAPVVWFCNGILGGILESVSQKILNDLPSCPFRGTL